jgi:hypothetical protein
MAGQIFHSWNGTVLTITSDSGTSSADLKGAPGDMGIRGAQGIPGSPGADGTMVFEDLTTEQKATLKGDKGDKGDTGADGKDYVLTTADKQEIAQLALAQMPAAEEGAY